jgi:predicted MFS family arabinose efflux permease
MKHDQLPEKTLWLMAAACGASAANIYYNQPLLGDFAAFFKATPTEASWVAVAAQTGYGLGLLFFLPLADLLERRRLVLMLISACVVLLLGTAMAPTLPILVLLQLLVGTTAMSAQILIPLAVEMTAPEKRGHTVGILMGGLLGGILLARTLSGFVGDHFGWRVMFLLAAGLMLIMALLLRAGLPHRPPSLQMRYGTLMLSLWQLLKTQPKLWAPSLVSALSFGSFTAFWTTLSFLMIDRFHQGATEAGLFGVVGLIGALGAPLAGKLADRKGVVFTVTLALLFSFFAFGLMSLWVTIPMLICGVLLMDLGVQSVQVAEQAKVIALLPEARSRINSLYMVMRFIGGAGGSLIGGAAWSAYRWPGVSISALILTALALLLHLAGTVWEAKRVVGEGEGEGA